MKQDVKKKNLY